MTTKLPVTDVWDRWRPIWRGVFVCLWVVAMFLMLTDPLGINDARPYGGILAIMLMLWYFLTPSNIDKPMLVGLTLYFLLGWVLWFITTLFSPPFFIVLFVLFPYVFMVMPLAQAVLLTVVLNLFVLMALNQFNPDFIPSWLAVIIATTITGSTLAYFITTIINQSGERKRLILELEAAQDQLAKSQYEAGILAERGRLAGELHDTITQGLVAIVMYLESIPTPMSHEVAQAITIARQNLATARQLIWDSESHPADYQHLISQLRLFAEKSSVPCEVVITGDMFPIPSQLAHALLRVVGEALHNIHKHALASKAVVTLSFMTDTLILDVHDDGIGFNPTSVVGFGLRHMQRRIENLGGEFSIESEIGVGTTITAILSITR